VTPSPVSQDGSRRGGASQHDRDPPVADPCTAARHPRRPGPGTVAGVRGDAHAVSPVSGRAGSHRVVRILSPLSAACGAARWVGRCLADAPPPALRWDAPGHTGLYARMLSSPTMARAPRGCESVLDHANAARMRPDGCCRQGVFHRSRSVVWQFFLREGVVRRRRHHPCGDHRLSCLPCGGFPGGARNLCPPLRGVSVTVISYVPGHHVVACGVHGEPKPWCLRLVQDNATLCTGFPL
jgi:hypothetical protein